jgi:hypothetical protein
MPEEINRLCTDVISDSLFTTDRLVDTIDRCFFDRPVNSLPGRQVQVLLSVAESDTMKTCWCWNGRHDIPPGEAIIRRRGSCWRRSCLRCYGREPEPDCWTLKSCIHCVRPLYLELCNKWGRKGDVQPLILACDENCRCAARAIQRHARARARRPSCCEQCTAEYMPSRTNSRYCSYGCKQKAYRKRQLRVAGANQGRGGRPRCCDQCAVEYIPKRTDSRYCSAACKQEAYRKRADYIGYSPP